MNSLEVSINIGVRYSTVYLLVYIFILDSLYILPSNYITHTLITTLPYKAT